MKRINIFIITFLFCWNSFSQKSFHVFPEKGSSSGNGSPENPWDLQTALNQKPEVINGGDTIWLHEGIYLGRFVSRLKSTIPGKNIVVSSYDNDWAILNGNIKSSISAVLEVYSEGVTFKNFEVTSLGSFSRNENDGNFVRFDGVNHYSGTNCHFLNLRIHNNPGSGFGSWKQTGNTIVENCMIYNNGFMTDKRGRGVGMYIQNATNEMRVVRSNTIFNNYYKGVEIWSASRKAKSAYVMNVIFEDNVLFNNGLVSGTFRDNLIVATDDVSKNNIARNIYIKNNVFYHNVSLSKAIENTEASSLTLGFNSKAPIEDIFVENNVIIGRKDAIRFLSVKGLTFKNNTVYSGYIRFVKNNLEHINETSWQFYNNNYFTRKKEPIRIQGYRDFTLEQWKSTYGLDALSEWQSYKDFKLQDPARVTQMAFDTNTFRVVIINTEQDSFSVDFSDYKLPKHAQYEIYNVEDLNTILATGSVSMTSKINFPLKLKENSKATFNNFGVYRISFREMSKNKEEINNTFLRRLWDWLGF